jgi:hypothetical protein
MQRLESGRCSSQPGFNTFSPLRQYCESTSILPFRLFRNPNLSVSLNRHHYFPRSTDIPSSYPFV